MGYRDYSVEDKAGALSVVDGLGGNVFQASKRLGLPEATLRGWVNERSGISDDVRELHGIKKGELADKLENVAHLLIDALPDKIDRAGLQAASVAVGVAIDKMRLLRGESTANVDLSESRAALHAKWNAFTVGVPAEAVPGQPE